MLRKTDLIVLLAGIGSFFRLLLPWNRCFDKHIARVGVGMVETVDQNLAGKIVRDERRDAFTLVVVEGIDVLGVANLMARNEILGKDGLVGICFSEASRSANCLPSMLIACWQR